MNPPDFSSYIPPTFSACECLCNYDEIIHLMDDCCKFIGLGLATITPLDENDTDFIIPCKHPDCDDNANNNDGERTTTRPFVSAKNDDEYDDVLHLQDSFHYTLSQEDKMIGEEESTTVLLPIEDDSIILNDDMDDINDDDYVNEDINDEDEETNTINTNTTCSSSSILLIGKMKMDEDERNRQQQNEKRDFSQTYNNAYMSSKLPTSFDTKKIIMSKANRMDDMQKSKYFLRLEKMKEQSRLHLTAADAANNTQSSYVPYFNCRVPSLVDAANFDDRTIISSISSDEGISSILGGECVKVQQPEPKINRISERQQSLLSSNSSFCNEEKMNKTKNRDVKKHEQQQQATAETCCKCEQQQQKQLQQQQQQLEEKLSPISTRTFTTATISNYTSPIEGEMPSCFDEGGLIVLQQKQHESPISPDIENTTDIQIQTKNHAAYPSVTASSSKEVAGIKCSNNITKSVDITATTICSDDEEYDNEEENSGNKNRSVPFDEPYISDTNSVFTEQEPEVNLLPIEKIVITQ